MTEITCVGLGLMGSALARAMLAAGHRITVWNRSPGKAGGLVGLGAREARSFAEALAASPVVMICIDSYASTRDLLAAADALPHLAGRVVVQLSTGTPREAGELSAWGGARGARYLDGAILCGPDDIGTPGVEILVSGNAEVWAEVAPLLACLAGKVRHVGEGVGHAAALDLAWLTTCYTEFLGVAHAANICRSEGVGLQAFIDLFPADSNIAALAKIIRDDDYARPTATLQVWAEALARIQSQARDAGISPAIPDFMAGYFRRAVESGLGGEEAIAIHKVLRGDGPSG